MDQEDKEILKKVLEISQKNSKTLGSIERSMFWSRIFRYVYWAVIIGVAVGAFYYIQPYIDEFLNLYGGIKGSINNVIGR